MEHPPLKTFIIYAREDRPAVNDLRKHLALLEKKELLELWFDGEILAGENWDRSIKRKLEQAELVLLLISVDFINSDYIEKTELKDALQRHHDGLARLIPIIVHPCDWAEYFEIGQFQALPNGARPVFSSHFPYPNEAYFEIQQGIKRSALDWIEQRAARLKAEAEAAEKSRREEERRLAQKREAEQKANAEKARAQRLRQLDEAAWSTALAEAETAESIDEKIIAIETYLDDLQHTLHRDEAETRLAEWKALETKRRIDEKKRAEAQRKAEEETRQKAAQTQNLPEMILIEGGTFQMGSEDGDADEKPVHKVTVKDFYLGKYPVTVAQFKTFIDASAYQTDADKDGGSYLWNGKEWVKTSGVNWRCDVQGKTRPEAENQHPVIHISWNDARAYCVWLTEKTGQSFRLPSEAEWEYAARGGRLSKGFQYAGSNDLKEVGWYHGNSGSKTHPVGEKKPNELGLYDMSGNVWEWCEDDWHGSYKDNPPTDGSAWVDNPRGSGRVRRGGSWLYSPAYARVALRNLDYPAVRNSNVGFRLARTP